MAIKTARSWDSYMDTLLTILKELQPKVVLEFGSGKSTGILAMFPSVKKLFTFEHDPEYFNKFDKSKFNNLDMRLVTNQDEYAYSFYVHEIYDLIFVDGVNRPRCIQESKKYISKHGVMILHDATREEYQDEINKFPYRIFTDDGSTVTLMQNEFTYNRLKPLLINMSNLIGVKG